MATSMAVISLLSLVAAIVIANVRKINVGIVGFAIACLLAVVGGIKVSDLAGGFNTSLFLRMLAIQALVCVARTNGTLEIISQKIIKVSCGRTIRLFPIFMFVFMVAAEFFGMGIYSLLLPILVGIAYELEMDVMKVCAMAMLTMQAGGLAPFSPPGVVLRSNAVQAGLDTNSWNIAICTLISCTIVFIVMYFLFGWHKEQPRDLSQKTTGKLTWTHYATIVGYIVYIVMNQVFDLDQMYSAMIVAVVLLTIGAAEPVKVLKAIPFPMLIMIGGMSLLVGVIKIAGGVTLLAGMITVVSNKIIAPAVMSIICGIMSTFSSANGVVIPTMIPTVPELIEAFPGLNAQAMVAAVGVGAYSTAVSPLSSSGSYLLGAYDSVYVPDEGERMKTYNKLFIFAGCMLVVQTFFSLVGLYGVHFFS